MPQVTQDHEKLFQDKLHDVDSHVTRQALQHVWDVLKEVAGFAAPVVEALVPPAAPIINSLEAGKGFSAADEAELVAYIDKMVGQLQKMRAQRSAASTTDSASTPSA